MQAITTPSQAILIQVAPIQAEHMGYTTEYPEQATPKDFVFYKERQADRHN